ncbi:MAG: ABC transporter permease [Paludibaculum sp.]
MQQWLGTIRQDLVYGARSLRKAPLFSVVAVLSLALGTGANTAIFTIVNAVMLQSLPVRQPDQLVQLKQTERSWSMTNPIWEFLRDNQRFLDGTLAWATRRFNLSTGGETRFIDAQYVSGGYFSVLGVRPAAGRLLTPEDDRRGCTGTAVISYDAWKNRFGGSPGVIGQHLTLDAKPFTIVGVTQRGFTGMDVGRPFEIAVPLCSEALISGATSSLDRRSSWWLRIYGRLKPGQSLQQASAALQALLPEIKKGTVPPDQRPELQQRHLSRGLILTPGGAGMSQLKTQYGSALLTLLGLVGLVLLLACANIANLLLARATARTREMSVRMAVGAGRARLVRQMLTESLLLSAMGTLLGALFAAWASRLLVHQLSPETTPFRLELAPDWRVLAFTAGIAVLTGLLFGVAPAFRSTDLDAADVMKQTGRGLAGSSRVRLGQVLVSVQVALSVVLVFGALLFVRTFTGLVAQDAGFQQENVLLAQVDTRRVEIPVDRRGQMFDNMLEELRRVPGVALAAAASQTPVSGSYWNNEIFVDGFKPNKQDDATSFFNSVSPGYFATLGTPLLLGRDFDQRETSTSPKSAIVNETWVKRFTQGRNPLGLRVGQRGGGTSILYSEVIGVVKDARYGTMREPIPPTMYLAQTQDAQRIWATFVVRAAAGNSAALAPQITRSLQRVNPNAFVTYRTFAAQIADSLVQERSLALLSGFFGVLALLLASIGLYGMLAYTVNRRRGEIGIRIALGARPGHVVGLVLRDVVWMIAAGVVAGGVAAYSSAHVVESLIYGVKPNDPATLATAAGMLAVTGLLAGLVPARRAAATNPMSTLREE